jgi:hypothetical protein
MLALRDHRDHPDNRGWAGIGVLQLRIALDRKITAYD